MGSETREMTFHFWWQKKRSWYVSIKKIRKIFTAKFIVKKIRNFFTAKFIVKKISKNFYSQKSVFKTSLKRFWDVLRCLRDQKFPKRCLHTSQIYPWDISRQRTLYDCSFCHTKYYNIRTSRSGWYHYIPVRSFYFLASRQFFMLLRK